MSVEAVHGADAGAARAPDELHLWPVLLGIVLRPRSTLRRLGGSTGRAWPIATAVVLAYGFLYTVTAVLLAVHDLRPLSAPALPIPAEHYYAAQIWFTLPGVLAAWGVLTVGAWLVLAPTGGAGHVRRLAALLGTAVHVPWIVAMWLPETAAVALAPRFWGLPPGSPAVLQLIVPEYLYLAVGWSALLAVLAVHDGAGASWRRSIPAGFVGVALAVGWQMLIFR